MPTILNLPITLTGLSKSVEFPVNIVELNDSYMQVTGGGKAETIWSIRTDFALYTDIDQWLELLRQYSGVTEFLIDLDLLGLKLVRCLEYSREFITHDRGVLNLVCVESSSVDCPELINSLNTFMIPSRLTEAFNFINRHISGSNTYITLNLEKKLPPNACHDVLGRSGYFPTVCGTTEGIFITIIALLDYYQISNNVNALNLAIEMVNGAYDVVYKGQRPPNPPNSQTFLPHWLYAAKGSTITKGTATEPNFLNGGNYTDAVSFTKISGSSGGSSWFRSLGSELSDVYKVFSNDGQLLWKYIFSSLISGSEYTIQYWIDKYNRKCSRVNGSIAYGSNDTGYSAGTLVINIPTNPGSLTAKIVYSDYVSSIVVNKNECLEAFPFWRRTLSNEFNHALDVSNWAFTAYEKLYQITGNIEYSRAADATMYSTLAAIDVKNDSFVFKIDTESGEPFSIAGTQLIKINNKTGTASRNIGSPIDGGLKVTHDYSVPTTYGQLEVQNFVVAAIWARATYLQTKAVSTIDNILFWGVSTKEDSGDFTGMYYAPVKYLANTVLDKNIVGSDFVKFTTKTNWHPTIADTPVYIYTSGGSVNYTQLNVDITNEVGVTNSPLVLRCQMTKGSYCGFGLNNPNTYGRKPPKIYYKVVSGTIRYILTDTNDKKFYVTLTATNWTLGSFGWSEFTPVNSGDQYSDQGNIKAVEFEITTSTADIYIYYVGEAPQSLPLPCYTYKTLVNNRTSTAHTWIVGTCEIKNSTLNILPYTPGVIPFTYNRVGNSKVSWIGEPMAGYQSARMMQKWGLHSHVEQIAKFWLAAQDSYTDDSPDGIVGIARQAYNWGRWDAISKPPFNRFVDTGSDPNVRWEGYAGRFIADAAEAWYHDPDHPLLSIVTMRFLRWIDSYWNLYGDPGKVPTDYIPPQNGIPQRLYTSPHGTALVLVAAVYANLAGGNRLITFRTIQRCFNFLEGQVESTGEMAGCWSKDQAIFTANGKTYKEFYPFWLGEIMRAYAVLHIHKNELRYPSCADYFGQ